MLGGLAELRESTYRLSTTPGISLRGLEFQVMLWRPIGRRVAELWHGRVMSQTKALVKQLRRPRAIVVAITVLAILLFCATSWHNYGSLRDRRIADARGDADHALI